MVHTATGGVYSPYSALKVDFFFFILDETGPFLQYQRLADRVEIICQIMDEKQHFA